MERKDRGGPQRVVLTRLPEDNQNLRRLLEEAGVEVLEAPCLDIVHVKPDSRELDELPTTADIDAVTFSSKRGVRAFFDWHEQQRGKHKLSKPALTGAVGPGTAKELSIAGWEADLVASPATGKELARLMGSRLKPESRVLIVRGNTSREDLSESLQQAGHRLCTLTVYENRETEIPHFDTTIDAIVFASPLGAGRFLEVNPKSAQSHVIAIGSTTEAYLNARGISGVVKAAPDDQIMAAAVLGALRDKKLEEK